ncbi:MAG: MarR family transcriptional regulator [Verrucomicrobiia bacterium]
MIANPSPIPPLEFSQEARELADIATFLQRHSLVKLTARVTEQKLSIPQYTLLGFLSAKGPLSMGQLATLMGHTTPATTGLVERLNQAGLVQRHHPDYDRRKVIVQITPKGSALVEATKYEMAGCITRIMERLSPEDRLAWNRIYRTIRAYVEENEISADRKAC